MDLLRTIPAIRALLEKRKLAARIPYKRMWEHLYMNGASGSGKSTLMKRIIFTLATRSNGIVLIDPQGKLASEVRAFEHLDRDRIVYFKPRLKTGYTPTINFLDKDRGKDTNSMALRLARVISIISQGELSNPMVSLLRPCLAGLIENEGYSLSDLKRFLIKEENDDLVQLGLSHPDPEYQSTFQRINSGYYNKTRDAIISKLDVVLQDKYFRNP
jgi:type IV secretory pathway VirB4 component